MKGEERAGGSEREAGTMLLANINGMFMHMSIMDTESLQSSI